VVFSKCDFTRLPQGSFFVLGTHLTYGEPYIYFKRETMPKHEIEKRYKNSFKDLSHLPTGKRQAKIQEVLWPGCSDL